MLHLGEVNLSKLCGVFKSGALSDSRYKRLRRFMKEVHLDERSLARLCVSLLPVGDDPWCLSMDRTNWKIGKIHVNILYLSLCYKSIGIPLFWSFLEDKKQGNSDHLDRIDLLELFIEVFGKQKIGCLTLDREFIGKEWLEDFLQALCIPYIVRLKDAKSYMANSHGKQVQIRQLFRSLNPAETVSLGKRKVGKSRNATTHYITALRTTNGELVVLAHSDTINNPCQTYQRRWNIETMFKAFKSAGFNLEDTRITHPDRLQTLTAVMAIAFCIAYNVGDQQDEKNPIKIKKHGYRAKSIPRLGINTIRNALVNATKIARQIIRNINKTAKYHINKFTEIKNVP